MPYTPIPCYKNRTSGPKERQYVPDQTTHASRYGSARTLRSWLKGSHDLLACGPVLGILGFSNTGSLFRIPTETHIWAGTIAFPGS
jgi:hypothetical protein